MKLKIKLEKTIQKVVDMVTSNGVMQEENTVDGESFIFDPMPDLIRKSADEGMVLLKNNAKVLPVTEKETVSVFGRCQIDYFYVGYGSGGDVKAPYTVNLIDGFINSDIKVNDELLNIYKSFIEENPVSHGYWGHWPMNYPEMPVELHMVKKAKEKSDKAIIVIGRAAGEDRENKLEKGSYYLTDIEEQLIENVTSVFDKVILIMNCGNIVDMSFTQKYGDKISSIIYAWQCGMESGNALADIISGKISPSGKLSDTIAMDYYDYPGARNFGGEDYNEYVEDIFVGYRYFETFGREKVLFPFGFGLSYTSFEITPVAFEQYNQDFKATVKVTNTGEYAGKEVVQLYVKAPTVKLPKAGKSLVSFKKTKLLQPGESEEIVLNFTLYDFASFDDVGKTGNPYSYLVEAGEYVFYVGNSVLTDTVCKKADLEFKVLYRLEQVCAEKNAFERIVPKEVNNTTIVSKERIEVSTPYLKHRIRKNLPMAIGFRGNKDYNLAQVAKGEITLDEFISTLTNTELEALTRGQGMMNSELGVVGNAGAFAGIIPSLREKGVKPIITTDGPAGIRIKKYTSLIPCGTALSCTWNVDLIEDLTTIMGKELRFHQSDVLLAPGMNIHRNVLCGRNFEYFSEDPMLTGKMAAAYVKGIQSAGVSACPKHFACNNQEVKRTKTDSRVSQRALREIYLKGFEICIKDSNPMNIMTSYNKINGVWSHYNYDLVTTVLRGEWGYQGNVMTDWWMQKSTSPEWKALRDNGYRVRAQVDVLMPGGVKHIERKYKSDGTLLETFGKAEGITRGELERTAKNVLNLVLKLKY